MNFTNKNSKLNKFDQLLNFRFGKFTDLDKIQKFYQKYWARRNLITDDQNFLLYEFGNNLNLNFLLSECKNKGSIESIIGFYIYSNNKKYTHVCGSMSLVNPSSNYPLIGIETLKRLKILTNCYSYCGTNTNPQTMLPLVKKFLSHHTSKMNHFFILNNEFDSYKIAEINKKINLFDRNHNYNSKIYLVDNVEELIATKIFNKKYSNLPYKSLEFFLKRYLLHPIYKYKIFLIKVNSTNSSILVCREVIQSNRKVLRIIDLIGDYKILPKLGNNLLYLIKKNNYEYLDLLCNLPISLFEGSLFINKNNTDAIIPNYFEPFIKKNVEIFYESSSKDIYLFRGDADGDRPNFRP